MKVFRRMCISPCGAIRDKAAIAPCYMRVTDLKVVMTLLETLRYIFLDRLEVIRFAAQDIGRDVADDMKALMSDYGVDG